MLNWWYLLYEPKFGAYVTKIVCIELQGKNEKQKNKEKEKVNGEKKIYQEIVDRKCNL